MSEDRIKILVIDDSDFLREAIRKFLEDYECDVLVSADGVSGIQAIVETKPELIFLDLLLPTINGIDLLRVIKMFDESKNIPVIVITGSKDAYLIDQCHELGVQKILTKPLTRKGIFNAVEEVIGDHEWKLEQDGFRVVSLPEPEALAREIYAWVYPSLH